MEQAPVPGSPLIPIIIFTIPLVIFNCFLAKRKGRSMLFYGALSFIPIVGMYLAIYLASLTDQSVIEKMNKLLTLLEGQ